MAIFIIPAFVPTLSLKNESLYDESSILNGSTIEKEVQSTNINKDSNQSYLPRPKDHNPKKNDQSAWKTLWRDQISEASVVKGQDIAMDKRQKIWPQILNQTQSTDTKSQLGDLKVYFSVH